MMSIPNNTYDVTQVTNRRYMNNKVKQHRKEIKMQFQVRPHIFNEQTNNTIVHEMCNMATINTGSNRSFY